MPIKKDDTGKRWVEMELLLPGTPEEVWQAMATGTGYSGWFAKTEIEERVGGAVRFDFGAGMTSTGEVTTWQPPARFDYVERAWSEGAPPVATEITITSRTGDRCVMRMVHALFTELDTWDDELEGFELGWTSFFSVLRGYLAHFAGAPAASFTARVETREAALPTWQRLTDALGLAGASVGEERNAASASEAFRGVVEHVFQDARQRFVLAHIQAPSPGFLLVGIQDKGGAGTSIALTRYVYGDAVARAGELEAGWSAWLRDSFGSERKTADA